MFDIFLYYYKLEAGEVVCVHGSVRQILVIECHIGNILRCLPGKILSKIIFVNLLSVKRTTMNKPHTPTARPTFEIDLNEKIVCFESSQNGIHGENCILIANKRKIVILTIALDNTSGEVEYNFEYRKIRDIAESEVRILKLCSQIIVKDIVFAAARNYEIKVFSANEAEDVCLKSIEAHDGYINSIDFSEDYLASGSDDHTCKIFSVKENFEVHSVLNFSAAVTCVKFNPEELNKLIISVKSGNVFIFCLKLRQSLYSFQTLAPLMYLDWSIKEPAYVAVLAGDQVFYYDISKPE